MKERPILMAGATVRSTLDGRKTQTRRIINPQPEPMDGGFLYKGRYDSERLFISIRCKQGQVGDKLWVKETFQIVPNGYDGTMPIYRADGDHDRIVPGKWKPSIFMPRKLSRITLEITGVRVERLQDISEPDAEAEGAMHWWNSLGTDEQAGIYNGGRGPIAAYQMLWESINGTGSWEKNPFCWVIEFKRI